MDKCPDNVLNIQVCLPISGQTKYFKDTCPGLVPFLFNLSTDFWTDWTLP